MSYDYDFSFYRDDILPNDDLHKSYMGLLRSEVDAGSGSGTSCNFPVTLAGGELEPAHSTVMYNGFSLFQTPPSLPLASSSSSEPSGLWELLLSQLSGSSGAPADNLSQTIPEPEEESASVQPAAATRPGKRKRRLAVSTSSGTHSLAKAMSRLPKEVQEALKKSYDCCKAMDKKDNSALYKHWFSNVHYCKAAPKYADSQALFICPAFIANVVSCKNAKAGRHDSSGRHSDNCAGFAQFSEECEEHGVYLSPVLVTKGEFNAVQTFRKTGGPEDVVPPLVQSAVRKLLVMMVKEIMLHPRDVSGDDDNGGFNIDDEDVVYWFSTL